MYISQIMTNSDTFWATTCIHSTIKYIPKQSHFYLHITLPCNYYIKEMDIYTHTSLQFSSVFNTTFRRDNTNSNQKSPSAERL